MNAKGFLEGCEVIKIPKGTRIHVEGFPFLVADEIQVIGRPENWVLVQQSLEQITTIPFEENSK